MYCKECGTELKGNELACPYCGKTVTFLNSTNIAPTLQQPNTMPAVKTPAPQTVAPSAEQPAEQTTEQTAEVSTQETPAATTEATQPTLPQHPPQQQANFCAHCGQRLIAGANRCGFCGRPIDGAVPTSAYPYFAPPTQPPVEKKGTALAVTALICSLVVPLGYFFAWIMGIIATVQGSKTKNTPALVMGIISIVVCAFAILGAISILFGYTDTVLTMTLQLLG